MTSTPEYDEVHSVSDLHLGGAPGHRIFSSGPTLAALIGWVAARPAGLRVALVINGDFIDFLAEPGARHFNPLTAVQSLLTLAADPEFAPVFAALHALLRTPRRSVWINLGNHDLELALPWVRDAFTARVCGDPDDADPAEAAAAAAARGRLHWVLDGTGVACTVAGARALFVHGNEVDDWNLTDHEQLRRAAQAGHCGGDDGSDWVPNAGARMVIDVMNPIKAQRAFVDLLKPETGAVVPILAALAPEARARLALVAPVAARLATDSARHAVGWLGQGSDTGAGANAGTAGTPPSGLDTLAAAPGSLSPPHTDTLPTGARLLAHAEQAARQRVDPMSLIGGDAMQSLGLGEALWGALTGQGRVEVLRRWLSDLDRDRSFAVDEADATFLALDRRVDARVDLLVAGHTHLERARRRHNGPGLYFNSGTWARLMRIAPETRQDPARFADLVDRMASASLAELDACPGLVMRPCTVVSLGRNAGAEATADAAADARAGAHQDTATETDTTTGIDPRRVGGCLRHARLDAQGRLQLDAVPGAALSLDH